MTGKPTITYPCTWTFRIIGKNPSAIKNAVSTLIPNIDSYVLKPGNTSKKGNYVSWHLTLIVLSEDQKNTYKQNLLNKPGIYFIL
ncbi:MAG: hypothetical protein PWP06_711 [Candidatus Marinimicrobia bacterium]|jgi:putative lipoic acid-binding regulatory protein|nr:hypothetical protein [Candidatus Neomarinimicrobiota bacterium]